MNDMSKPIFVTRPDGLEIHIWENDEGEVEYSVTPGVGPVPNVELTLSEEHEVSISIDGVLFASNLKLREKFLCDQCGKPRTHENEHGLAVAVRSQRVNSKTHWAMCGEGCRDKFWNSSSETDLIPYSSDTNNVGALLDDDTDLLVTVFHKNGGKDKQKAVSATKHTNHKMLNTWFKTATENDSKLKLKPEHVVVTGVVKK